MKKLMNGLHGCCDIRPKTKLKMRFFILFFIVTLFQLQAKTGYGQNIKINLDMENVSVFDIIQEIESKTELKFFYSKEELESSPKIDIYAKNEKIHSVLKRLFSNGYIKYKIIGKQIVLKRNKLAKPIGKLSEDVKDKQVSIDITGIVTDSNGQPLPGANIIEKNTNNGTQTDFDGEFSLQVASEKSILVISFLGFKAQEVTVGNRTELTISLLEDAAGLDEVVIVGYGTMKKADLTGSVATVRSEDITKTTSNNIGQAIQGRMSGVQITQSSGAPGASSSIKIRGVGSINSNNSPLVLVDGIPGNMNLINANEIESLTVLKDASAAAIYGNRAANGVILIKTKRGKAGKIVVNLKVENGVQQATNNNVEYLDKFDWVDYQNAVAARNGTNPIWVGDLAPENLPNTDWLDYSFNTSPVQSYDLSISGGSEKSTFSLLLGYFEQEGILGQTDGDNNFSRINARLNLDSKISDSFKVGANFSFVRSQNNQTSEYGNLLLGASRIPPVMPIYNSAGEPAGTAYTLNLNDFTPAIAANARDNINITNRTQIDLFAELGFLKDFKWKSTFSGMISDGWRQDYRRKLQFYHVDDVDKLSPNIQVPNASLANYDESFYRLQFNSILNYSKNIGLHSIDALVGIELIETNTKRFNGSGENFPNDELRILNVAQENWRVGGTAGETAISSQFARINYSYDNKYLFQANVRRDGSYVFASENRWGWFPSFSAGWKLSEENFLKDNELIRSLKIRGGYGTLGNSQIPPFQWVSTLNVTDNTIIGSSQSVVPIAYLAGFSNTNIKWEKTSTSNIGVDMGLFDNKLDIVFDVYNRKTTDMLLRLPVPLSTGFSRGNEYPFVNLGVVENKGWELAVNFDDVTASGLSYGLGFNISQNKNKVTDMGGQPPITSDFYRTEQGEAINSYFGFRTLGIWQSNEEIANNPSRNNVQPGDIRVADINSTDENGNVIKGVPDGQITTADMTILGNSIPEFYYGFNASLNWKGFDFNIFFQGEADKQTYMRGNFANDLRGRGFENILKDLWDGRTILNDDFSAVAQAGKYPAAGTTNSDIAADLWLEDASYLRIKNLQFGYTFPGNLSDKLGINSLRLYFNATNLYTFTNYRGFDPETANLSSNGGAIYPQSRTYAVGLNLSF
ncbi:SusC/RagA family TonB-linked outer membrane protein [Flavivirga rizhaonensis]|uniref:TonB-dependent receptor n=1 Tax=Flavivirga rizhaonensis TaxID=2559571 RepID=A0A4S1DXB7_9FLAO|nr:TonB-dependent receptor [Flavivirga rizhaonensis]TGV02583.1 TonB-dependent receptor [Flavivirga rizhaonensis]